MSIDQITAEQEASESLIKLLQQAKTCQMLYQRAHMSLPEPLKRVLGMNGSAVAAVTGELTIPALEAPPMPAGAKSDWMWIRQEDATPTSIALATLRAARKPVRARDVIAFVTEVLPNVPRGSINNIGSRLDGKLISRSGGSWSLIHPEKAGVFSEGYLWGPKESFQKNELAAHRRMAILHILRFFEGGLQTTQIVEQLRRCAWVHAPVNKDLLKADLSILDKQEKVRRRGNSGKWELAPTKEEKAMKLET
jgi:hypothetical protein